MVREVTDDGTGSCADGEIGPGGALLIAAGGDWHAIEIGRVREVVSAPQPTKLPTVPGAVLGVFNLRGEIVPLLDVEVLLSLGVTAPALFAVVVESIFGPAAIAASTVPETVSLSEPIGPSETPGTSGLYAVGTRIVTFLDLDALIAPDRIGAW